MMLALRFGLESKLTIPFHLFRNKKGQKSLIDAEPLPGFGEACLFAMEGKIESSKAIAKKRHSKL